MTDVLVLGSGIAGLVLALHAAERGEVLAAVAPSAGIAVESIPKLKPKPVMHIAGEKDSLVKFEWQAKTIAAVNRLGLLNRNPV